MELRGQRECQSCGSRWSYYETGEITCPDCGSVRSVGLDEPTEHTASSVTLDLTPVQADIDEEPIRKLADRASELCRDYVGRTGFVHAGTLQPLDDTYLAATELRRVGATLGRLMQVEDDEQLYFLSLLRGADQNERPEPQEVPDTLAPERGLAVASSVEVYATDLKRACPEREQAVGRVLSSIRTHRKRIEALDGDVDPEEAEQLVRTIRDLSAYLREENEAALARATDRL